MKTYGLVLLALFASQNSFAGSETANGGGAIVCRNVAGQITSVELLDIWEARALLGYGIPANNFSMETQLKNALDKLSIFQSEQSLKVADYVTKTQKERLDLPTGIGIMPPHDAQNSFVQEGCTIEGVGLYNDAQATLSLNPRLYNLMDETNKAAFWAHEAYYKFLRDHKFYKVDENSAFVRKMIGFLFSTKPWGPKNSPPPTPNFHCETTWGDEFFMYGVGTKTEIAWYQVRGAQVKLKTAATVDHPFDQDLTKYLWKIGQSAGYENLSSPHYFSNIWLGELSENPYLDMWDPLESTCRHASLSIL